LLAVYIYLRLRQKDGFKKLKNMIWMK